MNLDFAKVCGKHSAIYDAYYKQIDPKGAGTIEAMTGAKFLKKSGLSDIVLSRVWDLADPNGKGYLDKPGFLVALKLVSVAQAGETVNMKNIYMETENPPKVGEIPKIMPSRIQTMPSASSVVNEDWKMSVIDRLKYEQLFESLKPVGGMLPGNKVKGVLLDSKLPMDTLGKIWDLADQDRDGNLDKHEFLVAMHLVYKTLEKRTVPDVLPAELRKPGGPPPKPAPPVIGGGSVGSAMPRAPSGDGFADGGFVANFPKDIPPPPAIPPMTRVPPIGAAITTQPLISTDPLIPIGAPPSVTATADWVVTPAEMKRFEVMFRDSDRDKDGLVSGLEVKNVFLQSGVPQNCLAHIWALCDTNQSGKLTLEQFALAMWMVERKQKGIEPPQVLTANMVPPSMRALISGVDVQQQEPKPAYTNPELEMISKEIEELAKERRVLETEIAQKEADIRIKTGEVRSLQSELDTLSATLKQLENQRGEAEKRLDDLKAQVNRIREQCLKQEETINDQEGELNTKRSELQKLRDEESALQKEYDDNNRELQKLTRHLQNTQLQISSVRSMVTQLMETQRQMTDALLICRAAIDSQNIELVSEYQLKIEPDFDDAKKTLEKQIESPKDDPFNANQTTDVHKTNNGFTTNGFGRAVDQFGANESKKATTNIGGFDDSFNTTSGFDSGFDAFGGSSNSAFGQQKDPFGSDAFSGGAKLNSVTPEPGKDDFGSDPFAVLHAPTGQGQVLSPNTQKSGPPTRPESPSPALPPKKSKVPPPRPAPPRPLQGPARPAQPNMDAFSSSTTASGFADFADFDNKLSSIPLPLSKSTTTTTTIQTPTTLPLKTASHALNNNLSLFDLTTTANSISYPSLSITSSLSLSSPNVNIATTTSTTNNPQLTRSTTPLSQQPSSIFNRNPSTTTTATTFKTKTDSVNPIRTKTPIVSGPTDFSDDPFKDYRYDDLCNIQDPFADDDLDPEKIFKDLSSDDEAKNSNTLKTSITTRTTSTSQSSNTYETTKSSEKGLSSEFLNHFDAFNINPSPVPSNKSTASVGKQTSSGMSLIANKSQSTTPLPGGSVVGAVSDIFDNFSDFDAFSTQSTTTNNNSGTKSDYTTINNVANASNDVFFDAFSDFYNPTSITDKNTTEIPTTTKTTTTTTATHNSKSEINANAFDDAFGGIDSGSATSISVGASSFSNLKNKDPFGEIKITNLKASKNAFDDDDEDDAFGSNKDFNTNIITQAGTEVESTSKNLTTALSAHQLFDDDTFEADFFNNATTTLTNTHTNININNNNNNNNNNAIANKQYQSKIANTTVNETFNTNFAKFDAFNNDDNTQVFDNVLNNSINAVQFKNADFVDSTAAFPTTNNFPKLQNRTVLAKTPNNNNVNNNNINLTKSLLSHDNSAKLTDKFAADYSKPETFDVDLEEALKRSMIDQ